MNPALTWDMQFNKIKEKLISSMKKLIVTEMTIYEAHIYFNMYIACSTYFRCRVIELMCK